MTRPEIIRADSIDLQDHDAPSAKNHSARPSPLSTDQSIGGTGTAAFAPHQAETLREVAAETAEEELHSPRVSWANGGAADIQQQQYADDLATGVTSSLIGYHNGAGGGYDTMAAASQQDDLAVAQNGGMASQDNHEDGDVDGDEGDLDDDMMDKISSSPSIDDGGSTYQLPPSDSFRFDASPGSSLASACLGQARSMSPCLDLPDYLPLQQDTQHASRGYAGGFDSRHHHLLRNEFFESTSGDTSELASAQRADSPAIREFGDHESLEDFASGSKAVRGASSEAEGEISDISGLDVKLQYEVDEDEALFDMGSDFEAAADLIVPYEDSTDEEDDDDDDHFFQSTNPRFVDSGWGGESLHDTEDIDFELVYALHTFIATVEGQANATKGDAMVLLDDSNSYWWLVRVVKDSSIGYLPAEHIETPTERLARLNKHRNIDLSATMLGDQAEKAKNPIKTAMRRRKTKNVSFAAPTYVDYSDFDYDTEEEEAEGELLAQQQQQQTQQQQQQAQQQQQQVQTQASTGNQASDADREKVDDSAKVAPLKPRAQKSVQLVEPAKSDEQSAAAGGKLTGRTSEEIFETNGVEGPKKKADGTVRDSFFKDDTVETKKITLTPNLLRDDGTTRASSDSLDRAIRQRPSFDKLEKELREDKKKGKDKKEKDKKGGFRSLFSRKDKKQRGDDDEDSFGKRSMEAGTESGERASEDVGDPLGLESDGAGVQRNTSKLQKQQPRVEPSPSRKTGPVAREAGGGGMDISTFLNEEKLKNVSNVPPASMRIVDPDADLFEDDPDPELDEAVRSASMDDYKQKTSRQGPMRSQSADDKPSKTTVAKSRMQIEDSDSDEKSFEDSATQPAPSKEQAPVQPESRPQPQFQPQPEREPQPEPEPEPEPQQQREQEQQQAKTQRPTLPGTFPDSYMTVQSTESTSTITAEKATAPAQPSERLSESPVQVSPITPSESHPPALTGDNSSQEDHSSPVSSPSPELIDREDISGAHRNQDSITTSTSTTVSTWNDTSLRAFFDSGSDIRDLLVVVYDKNDVEPVGPDHPVAGALFKEQNAKLAEITTQLDNMLGDWLARKQRLRGTV